MILINLFLQVISSYIVGIDLGTDSIKIETQNNGNREEFNYEKNLFPNIISHQDEKLAYGKLAEFQCRIYPDTCYQNRSLPLNDEIIFPDLQYKGYQYVSFIFKNIFYKRGLTKLVVAISPSLTGREKALLYTSLRIGIASEKNFDIQFISSTYAPILTYINDNLDLTLENSGVIIDIGHVGIRLSAFLYNNKISSQKVEIKNETVGGKTVDENLYNIIVSREKLTLSPKDSYILLAKIRKAKELLTKLNETSFEFQLKNIKINRNDIEQSCIEIKEALNKIIHEFIIFNSEFFNKITKIYLIGGSSQIPCLKKFIHNLVPNLILDTSMNPISSVCRGACLYLTNEKLKKITKNDPFYTNDFYMKNNERIFNISYNSVIILDEIDRSQKFQIFDKKDNNREFLQFFLKKKNSYKYDVFSSNIYTDLFHLNSRNNIEKVLSFSMNNILVPVPDESDIFDIEYDIVGWEIPSEIVDLSSSKIRNMNVIELKADVHSEKIDHFIDFVQKKLKKFIFSNWRRLSFPSIRNHYENQLVSCLKENDYECPDRKIDEIVSNFKSTVSSYLKIDVSDYDDKDESLAKINDDNL